MGLPDGFSVGGGVAGFPSAVVLGAGAAGTIVGGGGGGWLRAVLCPPHAESSSVAATIKINQARVKHAKTSAASVEEARVEQAFRPARDRGTETRLLSASSAGSGVPSIRRPGSSSRWRCAAPCSNARGSPA